MPAPKLFTDEELCEKACEAQATEPLLSEGALCGVLGVGREYMADRAKAESADGLITRTRKELAAVRQLAWERKGVKGCDSKFFNSTQYIWMTRNILGWRDRQDAEIDREAAAHIKAIAQLTPAELEKLRKAGGYKK